MPSLLTRGVFRRILSSQPLVVHRHTQRATVLQPKSGRATILHNAQQRRSFLGALFSREKPKRDPTQPLLDPGMREMLSLERKLHFMVRLQPPAVLAGAFNAFIRSKKSQQQDIEDSHAIRLLQTFDAMERQEPGGDWLSIKDLHNAMDCIRNTSLNKLEDIHLRLAKRLFDKIGHIASKRADATTDRQTDELDERVWLGKIMSVTGHLDEARALMEPLETEATAIETSDDATHSDRLKRLNQTITKMMEDILQAYVNEKNDAAIAALIESVTLRFRRMPVPIRWLLVGHYASQDNVQKVKELVTADLAKVRGIPSAPRRDRWLIEQGQRSTTQEFLAFCIRNKEMAWADKIFKESRGQVRNNLATAAVLAAAMEGRSPDDIAKMIDTMSDPEGNPLENGQRRATLYNAVIKLALEKNDSYAVERYFSFIEGLRQQWPTDTFILQTQHRISANDVKGALNAYDALRLQTVSENEDWDIMNMLIQFLTRSPGVQKTAVTSLAADMSDRQLNFPPATVRALAAYHILRDEYFEATDLLQTYSHQFSIRDRTEILTNLAELALAPDTDTARTWDTYMILHQVFDLETTRPLRQRFLERMFDRHRPDLGVHIFTRMARHARADTRPDHATYLACFTGIARTPDPDALQVVHNLLKLDTDVEPDTAMRTALMLAYVGVAAPWRALEFWQEISLSEEGPSIASLHAVFRTCERSPLGERTSMSVWRRLIAADIAIDGHLFASYMGALAGNRMMAEIAETLPRFKEITGEEPGFEVFATLVTASRGTSMQEEIEAFLKDKFPGAWESVLPHTKLDGEGHMFVDFDRTVKV